MSILSYRACARASLKESSERAALTSDQHEKDGKYLLVVRVGGNVAEAHGDEARETKVEGRAVAALKRAVQCTRDIYITGRLSYTLVVPWFCYYMVDQNTLRTTCELIPERVQFPHPQPLEFFTM